MTTEDKPVAITFDNKPIVFTPIGENEEISLTPKLIRSHIAVRTKSGQVPSDSDLIKFLMLCKSGGLNPWTKDAYLVGYDSRKGPVFTSIVAHQALFKRAENNPQYRGIESGIVVTDKEGETVDREGDLMIAGDVLIGGWAKVYRADRVVATSDRLSLLVYSTGLSRWAADPCGMISKCAEGSSLRKAFSLELGGFYTQEEMDHVVYQNESNVVDAVKGIEDEADEKNGRIAIGRDLANDILELIAKTNSDTERVLKLTKAKNIAEMTDSESKKVLGLLKKKLANQLAKNDETSQANPVKQDN